MESEVEKSSAEKFWRRSGLNAAQIRGRLHWLAQPRDLGSAAAKHFRNSSDHFTQSRSAARFVGPAFSEAVIGLEGVLRKYRGSSKPHGVGGSTLAELLRECVECGILNDTIFRHPTSLESKDLTVLFDSNERRHAMRLSKVIPALRNDYVHGKNLAMKEFFHLAIDMRAMADEIVTHASNGHV